MAEAGVRLLIGASATGIGALLGLVTVVVQRRMNGRVRAR
jgi:hypothetical protein